MSNDRITELARDIVVGRRNRKFMRQVKEEAEKKGLDYNTHVLPFYKECGLPPLEKAGDLQASPLAGERKSIVTKWFTEEKKEVCTEIGVDWEAMADFMEAIVPLIIELIEVSAALAANDRTIICKLALGYAPELAEVSPELHGQIKALAAA